MEKLRTEREQLALARHALTTDQQRIEHDRQQSATKADETLARRGAELDEAASRVTRERVDLQKRQQRLVEQEQELEQRSAEFVSESRRLEAENAEFVRRTDEAEAGAAALQRQLDAATMQLEGRTRELQEVLHRERTLADRIAELEASERAALAESGLMKRKLDDLPRDASAPGVEPDTHALDEPDPELAVLGTEVQKLKAALHDANESAWRDRNESVQAVRDRRNLIWAAIVACTAMTCLLLFWLAANS
ncbi:MAG: hypothetical protein ACREJT_11345 [Myxococcota bacterium]